jgi:hypothetical protein
MSTFAGQFIALCWAIFFIYWIIAAFWTKRTAERHGWWSGSWVWPIIAAFLLLRRRPLSFSGGAILWRYTPASGIIADLVKMRTEPPAVRTYSILPDESQL